MTTYEPERTKNFYLLGDSLVQPFLIRTGVTTQEEVEQTYQQMLSEMQSDDFCAGAFSLTVWGTRL